MTDKPQKRIVVFGKGGVGKSTFASNLSAHYASSGLRVLHIGCDPKGDSTLYLLEDVAARQTVMSWISTVEDGKMPTKIFNSGRLGIQCIEAGGPEAGIGCGGRGIARALEYLETWEVFTRYDFDVIIFDVLGDVVCGGFAAPLRKGFGNIVVIVAAEDEMSYYAANNIARAVERYRENGVALAGLVINGMGQSDPELSSEDFAKRINADILGRLPKSAAVSDARREQRTAVEFDPGDPYSQTVAQVATRLLNADPDALPRPTPLDHQEFIRLTMPSIAPTLPPPSIAKPKHDAPRDGASRPGKHHEQRPLVIDRFSMLLEFSGDSTPPHNYRLLSIEPGGGGLLLEIEGPSAGPALIHLRPQSGEKSDAATQHFDMSLKSDTLTAPVARLLRHIARRFGSFTLQQLIDIHAECVSPNRPQHVGHPGVPGGAKDDAGKWARFFAEEQFRRNVAQTLRFDIPCAQIMHRDLECAYATPPIRNDEFNYYNYPWVTSRLEREVPRRSVDSVTYETNLKEQDIILGARDKLSSVVDRAIRDVGDRRLILFNNTCIPVVAGEDVPSIVKDARARCPVPLMYEGPENSIGVSPLESFFIALRRETGFRDVPSDPKALNLIGFPHIDGFFELMDSLQRSGAKLNAYFLPNIEPAIFDVYRAAATSVFFPNPAFDPLYNQLFADEPVRRLDLDAPFGLKQTSAWLHAVGEALGMSDDFKAAADSEIDAMKPEWDALVRRASAHSLGFVVDKTAMERLSDPARTSGVPLLPLLREMGFGIEFFLFSAGKNAPENVSTFSTPEELQSLLEQSPCRCVYSDFYFDPRIAKAGKAQFSLQGFDIGFAGALRSLKRLVDVCELPFFNLYGKYT